MSINSFNSFDKQELLYTELANRVLTILKKSIDEDGFGLMAVSGGSTPKPFFEFLSRQEFAWEKVTITLVDERWVENPHPDSNEKLVRNHLLQNQACSAHFLGLKNSQSTPFAGVQECNKMIESLKKPFDIVILGMGNDGHTASFFPNDDNLTHALTTQEACAATIPNDAPHERLTLSLNTILKAKHIFLHFEGVQKKAVYDKAVSENLVEETPISAVLENSKSVEVYYGKQ